MFFIINIINKIFNKIFLTIDRIRTIILFKINNVTYSTFRTNGVPFIMAVGNNTIIKIGQNFAMNNEYKGNRIGFNTKCTIIVGHGCKIIIGNNVGISQTTLIAQADITIKDNVKIGGGVKIYTTDFHSLDPSVRASEYDCLSCQTASIIICEHAFIGAGSIILKGVTIGRNSIIGAGSVVTKDVPDNEIWAGNPARFIRKINYYEK